VILWSTTEGHLSYVYPNDGYVFLTQLCYQFQCQSEASSEATHEVNLWTAYKDAVSRLSEGKITAVSNLDGKEYKTWQIPESVGIHPFTFRKVNQDDRCKKITYYDYNARQSDAIAHFVNNFDQGINSPRPPADDRAKFPFTIGLLDMNISNSRQIDLDWIHCPY
jgi:hypothetical protein